MRMPDKELGQTIAFHRQRRGLSQREFAPLINRSEAWLSQVERGIRSVKGIDVLEKIAEVLDIPLSELAPTAPTAVVDKVPSDAIPLRLMLSANYALRAALDKRDSTATIDTLRDEAAKAWTLAHSARYAELIPRLEWLLPTLESAALRSGDEAVEAHALLAKSYHACAAALEKLGQFDAAWVAADRAISDAGRAADPLLMAEGAFRLTLVFQGARQLEQARHTAETAAIALRDLANEGGITEALSLYGALNLQLAVIAARTDRADDAAEYLQLARQTADRIGHDRNDYETEFGPTNVRLHEVAVAVELGDAGSAIRTADAIDARGLSPERQGRLLIDVARAWTQRRNVAEAVAALIAAERITPEQVASHRLVKTMLRDLLRMEHEPAPVLVDLANRAGVAV